MFQSSSTARVCESQYIQNAQTTPGQALFGNYHFERSAVEDPVAAWWVVLIGYVLLKSMRQTV
jgi:hypothetical protein